MALGEAGAGAPHAIQSVQSHHAGDFLTYTLRTMQIWDRGHLLRNISNAGAWPNLIYDEVQASPWG